MAVTLHSNRTFRITDDNGDVVGREQGLYHEDTRFLRDWQLRLDGAAPLLLNQASTRPEESRHGLFNPILAGAPRGTLGIVRRHLVGGGLHEDLDIDNFGDGPARFDVEFRFA